MNWLEVFTIIGVNATIIIWMVNKLDADVKSLGNRLDGHANRIDQLYKMFIDAQKENHEKFYELLKEQKK